MDSKRTYRKIRIRESMVHVVRYEDVGGGRFKCKGTNAFIDKKNSQLGPEVYASCDVDVDLDVLNV